jgi:ParB family protein of integrating conjugative element (PFGI_1 class)
MTSKTRLPETISIKDLAQQMEKQGRLRPPSSGPSSTAQRRALLATHSLTVKSPENAAVDLKAGQDAEGWMMLRCTDVDCYDRNPRLRTNPLYADIRASIKSRAGLHDAIAVTRRPGSGRYMCYAGANTRLQVVQELWRETHDARYEWVRAVFRPWVSESDVLAAHLTENQTHGETTFWEKARGAADLKGLLESELGSPLSLRAFSERAGKYGLKLHTVTAVNYLFAVERLAAFGPHLTHESTGAIRARFGHLEKLAEALNLDPYVRQTEFQELVSDAGAAINAVREQDNPPRLTAMEVERILAQLNAQFARQANCPVSAVEQTLRAVMGAAKPLSAAEIRVRLFGGAPLENSAAIPTPDSGVDGLPVQQPPASQPKRASRASAAGSDPADDTGFAAALDGFSAQFRISSLVRRDDEVQGFRVEPLPDGDLSTDGEEGRARHAAHRLLLRLSDDAGASEADAQHIVSLLLQPAHWPLMRTLMDAWHRRRVADGSAE